MDARAATSVAEREVVSLSCHSTTLFAIAVPHQGGFPRKIKDTTTSSSRTRSDSNCSGHH